MRTELDYRWELKQEQLEGREEGREETARNFKAKGFPVETIAECTGLPIETVLAL